MTNDQNKLGCGDAGFTLVETLVAVFILSVVSIVSLGIFSSFADANQAMSNRIGDLREIESARNYIHDDMQNVANRPARNQLGGNSASLFTSEPSTTSKKTIKLLRFTRGSSAIATADPAFSPAETIEYWQINDTLVRRSYDRPDPTTDTPFRDYVMLRNIQDIELRFFNGNIWLDEWVSGPKAVSGALPRAIDFSWSVSDPRSGRIQEYRNMFPVGGIL